MARFSRPRRRRRRVLSRTGPLPPRGRPLGRPPVSWGVVVAIGLLVAGVPMLLFNRPHSGDPLKIRRELRKF
ncbi:hypothetical protein H6G65_16215 [Microcystis elabens FACHB-917]|nr:hypothetical protein [Microcystis elabens FACHB-917]